MAFTPEQTQWLNKFSGMQALKNSFDRENALKREYLIEIHKVLDEQKEVLRDAMTFDVVVDGDVIGQMLADEGTQLDEVDFTEMRHGLELSEERELKILHAGKVLDDITEWMKRIKVDRTDPKSGKTYQARLFSDQEITDEIYAPLVRERILPETMVDDLYSETQQMLNETNALYQKRVAEKKEAGELDEYDRTGALITLGSGLMKVGGELAGAFPGPDAKFAADVLELGSLTVETGGEIRDAIKNSGFPDAADSIIDNVGSILEKVVAMATNDKDLAKTIGDAYKVSGHVAKAGFHFAKGEAGVADGMQSLADGLVAGSEFAGDNRELKEGLIIAANGLANAGHGYNIGTKLAAGDTKGVVDGITAAAKTNLSNIVKLETIERTEGQSEEQATATEEGLQEEQKSIEELIDWSGLGLKTVANVVDAAKQRDIAGSVNAVLDGVGEALGDVLKRAGVPDATADVVANSYAAGITVSKVTAALIEDPPNKADALTELGSGFESAFKAAFPDNRDLNRVGASIATVFMAGGKAIDIKKAYDDEEYDKVVSGIESVATAAVTKVFDVKKDEETEGLEGEARTEVEDSIAEELEESRGEFERPESVNSALEKLKELSAGEIAANQRQQEDQAAVEEMLQVEQDMQEMRRLLQQGGESGVSAAEASKIDNLIKQMVKDRMILDLAAKIAEGGTAVAAKFCPALEVANAAVKMAKNIYAAAIRAQEMAKWLGNTRDFEKAQSALSSASQNFVRNQAEQFSHYTIQAALEAVRMIGEIAACSGIAAAAGKAISASASAASAAEEIIRDFARQEDLERTWKLTCKAFNNPSNRKLGLRVRALNPTLAKYTIAWGAVIKNDPLAKNAMAGCGLNETTLSHPDSNVDKVVDYLEIYFRDDLTLYREAEMDTDWIPELELTARSWSAVKVRAEKNIKLTSTDTGKLDGMLSKLASLQKAANAGDVDDLVEKSEPEALEALRDLLDSIAGEFASYRVTFGEGADRAKGTDLMRTIVSQYKNMSTESRNVATRRLSQSA